MKSDPDPNGPRPGQRNCERRYRLPEDLAGNIYKSNFVPAELRDVCREAGESLGRTDAGRSLFRSAADMVTLWRGLDLPAWEAPYILRAARLGYLTGYTEELVSGNLSGDAEARAAEARWGTGWEEKLAATRERSRGWSRERKKKC